MRKKQRGVTLIGWLFLLAPLAVLIYVGIRTLPLYLNYMKVAKALNQVQVDYRSGGASPTSIQITKDGAGWLVEAAYEDEAPLFDNISLHIDFDKRVHAGGD